MIPKKFFAILSLLSLLLLMSLPAKVAEAAPVWKLKLQAYVPKGLDPQYVVVAKYADIVRDYTNGQVDITVYSVNELVPPREIYSAVAKGVIDAGVLVGAYLSGQFPELSWTEDPFITNASFFACLEAGVKNINDRRFASTETKILAQYIIHPFIFTHRSKPLKTLEDFKGAKLRGHGGIADRFMIEAGAGVVVMPMAEVYHAAKTGVIEGFQTGMAGYMSLKGYEVAPYITTGDGITGGTPILMFLNLGIWNKFPENIKQAFYQSERALWWWFIDYINKYNEDSEIFFKSKGSTITRLTPEETKKWAALYRNVSSNWYKKNAGVLGEEILKIVEKTRKYN